MCDRSGRAALPVRGHGPETELTEGRGVLDTVAAVAADARDAELLRCRRMTDIACAPGRSAGVLGAVHSVQVHGVAAATMGAGRSSDATWVAPVAHVIDHQTSGNRPVHHLVRDAVRAVRGPSGAALALLDVDDPVSLRIDRTRVRPAGVRSTRSIDVRIDVRLRRQRTDDTCRRVERTTGRVSTLMEAADAGSSSVARRRRGAHAAVDDAHSCLVRRTQHCVVASGVVRLAASVPVALPGTAWNHTGARLRSLRAQRTASLYVAEAAQALVVAVADSASKDWALTARNGAGRVG